jgi:tRNA(Ile)-lysidine synthase
MPKQLNKLTLEQRVLRFIREKRLIDASRKLVVAVSGGPDSVCMLHILAGLSNELGIKLHIAHLDHKLRGRESAADAEYVSDLANRLRVPATVTSRDVAAYRREYRLSLEEAAREVRYAFLAEVAGDIGADRIAVGHTLDDQAETILMHLVRGSGTRGLRGLLPQTILKSGRRALTVVRPLLGVSRADTIGYCRLHLLCPRDDSSNTSLTPLRNRVRHELLPMLREYNPNITESLLRTARLAGDDLAYLDVEAGRLREDIVQIREDTAIIDRPSFQALPAAMQRHLLRNLLEILLGNIKDVEAAHIEEIINILDRPAGKKIVLPGGLTFLVERDRFLLGVSPESLSPYPPFKGKTRLKILGRTVVPGWEITAEIGAVPIALDAADDFSAVFDLDLTGEELTVRTRRPGDRFQPLGMSRPKKLNEFMIDAGIPRAWRPYVPLVCSGEQIIWVVGRRIDERVKVTENTSKVLRLAFKRPR